MKKQELDAKLKELETQYIAQCQLLKIAFCKANNPYKVGDIFTDSIGSIRIEKIGFYLSDLTGHTCAYTGVILKKDGKETKNREQRTAYQSNEKKS